MNKIRFVKNAWWKVESGIQYSVFCVGYEIRKAPRPVRRPTLSLTEWVKGLISKEKSGRGVKLTIHHHILLESRKSGATYTSPICLHGLWQEKLYVFNFCEKYKLLSPMPSVFFIPCYYVQALSLVCDSRTHSFRRIQVL
jgi:hypothetical protein